MSHGIRDFHLCGFKMGRMICAIPLSRVREFWSPCPVTPIPRSPGYIGGLVNYRGKIVMSIDVRELLGICGSSDHKMMNVVVHGERTLCCLEVDEVVDVIDVRGKLLNETPGNFNEKMKYFTKGIYKLNDGLAIVLDLDRVLNAHKYQGS